ncbi:MAG: CopG family transcriptional regulator [Myxococcota bacterium]
MKAVTVKLEQDEVSYVDALARRRGLTRSDVVRDALVAYRISDRPATFGELAADLAGSVEGPRDLASNADHMDGYGK